MRYLRFTLLAMLATMTGCALIIVQFSSPSMLLGEVITGLAATSMPIAMLAAIFSRGAQRAFAVGFCLFALIYFAAFVAVPAALPPTTILERVYDHLHETQDSDSLLPALQRDANRFEQQLFEYRKYGLKSTDDRVLEAQNRLLAASGGLQKIEQRATSIRAGHFAVLVLAGYVGGLFAQYFYKTRDR